MEPAVLTTKRKVLAQLVFCVGCCCGRVDRGRPEVPVEKFKEVWRAEQLNRTVQLTITGCLGPCDLPNVTLVILPEGNVWLGGLVGDAVYGELIGWARRCHAARSLKPLGGWTAAKVATARLQPFTMSACHLGRRVLPLPPSLNAHRFKRHGEALATG
jgi:cobaltochelatase CobN